ncbi:MAG TPA: hypothetical protein VM490_24260, partial [Armatimonadaceae bacterium]|nr:hypothetical protein [Armatimonadaceae bacterium]
MSTLKEYRDEKRRDRQANAQIDQDIADREAARRRMDETHRLQLKASAQVENDARRRVDQAQRRARLKETFGKLPELGMSALWATMIVLPLTLAWLPQATFAADNLHIPSPFHHLFPAVIECAAWLCAFEAHRRG